ncbi:hypothetical protein PENSPDRAFT_695516, partial [Peniophora sp. CONT]
PPLVSNKKKFKKQLAERNLEEGRLYLTNTEDSIAYSAIKCVLTVSEFETLNFDESIKIMWDGNKCNLV